MEGSQLRRPQPVREVRRALRPWVLCVGLALGTAPRAWADELAPPANPPSEADIARAKELFENGQILYDEGRYEAAVTAWQASYRLSGYPDLLFNISGAQERLGAFQDALDTLNRYRVYAPADERETIERRMRTLEERIAKQPAAPTVAPPVVKPAGKGPPVGPIVLTSVGAAGLGFGIYEAARSTAALDALNEVCVSGETGLLCPADAREDAAQRNRSAVLAVAGLGGGALAVAGGLAWLVLGASSDDVAIAPTFGPTTGLTVAGRF